MSGPTKFRIIELQKPAKTLPYKPYNGFHYNIVLFAFKSALLASFKIKYSLDFGA